MVDDKDEYELSDKDLLGDPLVPPGTEVPPDSTYSGIPAAAGLSVVQRNLIIVIGFLITLFILYKLISFFLPSKPVVKAIKPIPTKIISQPAMQPAQSLQPLPATIPSPPPPSPPSTVIEAHLPEHIHEKITSLSNIGEGLRQDMNSLSDQFMGVQNNVQSISDKVGALTTAVDNLVAKLSDQNREIEELQLKLVKLTVKPKVKPKYLCGVKVEPLYVQAIIPGRAWLKTPDGRDTLSVREGSPIPGYGTVLMIQPNQGRVLTSSGKMIKFSHQDN